MLYGFVLDVFTFQFEFEFFMVGHRWVRLTVTNYRYQYRRYFGISVSRILLKLISVSKIGDTLTVSLTSLLNTG